jgi:hypothetical protein
MRRRVTSWLTIVLVLGLIPAVGAATSTVVLAIGGMT